jgi:pimeloyl-ACP methyl ester carboxylesterase
MKTPILKLALKKSIITLIAFSALLFACNENQDRELIQNDYTSLGVTQNWQDVLPDIFSETGIFVNDNESLMQAIEQADAGSTIYLAPVTYSGTFQIERSDLTFIGIDGSDGTKAKIKQLIVNAGAENLIFSNVESENIPDKFKINLQDANSNSFMRSGAKKQLKINRTDHAANIAHYVFEIRLGNGPYDVIKLHRVVNERRPYRPIRTKGEVFMVHGSSQDFDDIFYTAGAYGNINPLTSSPEYLASMGIDVWGIDLGWTSVPIEETDLSTFEDWGLQKDIDHTLSAMSIARLIRGLTGQGFGKLNLLGFSYGGAVAYAAAGQETQQHWIKRDIKGIIPVDFGLKYEPTEENLPFIETECQQAINRYQQISEGNIVNDLSGFVFLGNLAATDPDRASPINPDLTNLQFLLAVAVFPGEAPSTEAWHFAAGTPAGLSFTDEDRWVALAQNLAPYMPLRPGYEISQCFCNEEDSYLDDYLSEIKVPILYIGAGGAFGAVGEYTPTLTSSEDISSFIVSLEENPFADYGHADLFMANNASELVWEPLTMWLLDHHK